MAKDWSNLQSLTEAEKEELRHICEDIVLQKEMLENNDDRVFILFDLDKQAELFRDMAD
jgi:hypothetical protein